jgi:hypothetical protein
MEPNWAAEHLQVIRTLMERSAVYRRALAPIMTFNGLLGTAAALVGWWQKIEAPRGFTFYWAAVGIVAVAGSFWLVRRQALSASEPFWSPPTRRITQALLPGLVAGLIISLVTLKNVDQTEARGFAWLPLSWVILYGCAMHAAGFFMPRGMKVFGWVFILGGCGLLAVGLPDTGTSGAFVHGVMGLFFGLLHLAYGIYLYFTEPRRNET